MNKILSILILGALLLAGAATAQVVTLHFTGTANTYSDTVFGLTGSAVPYDFSLTYDTSASGALLYSIANGAAFGSHTAGHDWYGYSAAAVTAVDLNFGTATWSKNDLRASSFIDASYASAILWSDTDLAVSIPARIWINFKTSDFKELVIGAASATNGVISLSAPGYASIADYNQNDGMGAFATSYNLTISSVPEPATTVLLLGLAAVGVAGLHRWRRQRRRH